MACSQQGILTTMSGRDLPCTCRWIFKLWTVKWGYHNHPQFCAPSTLRWPFRSIPRLYRDLIFLIEHQIHEIVRPEYIGLTISPLSTLIIEQGSVKLLQACRDMKLTFIFQTNKEPLATVAICQETVAAIGKEQLYEVNYHLLEPKLLLTCQIRIL